MQTARNFVELYPSFYIPISVHKLLIYAKEIIASSLMPIGQISEDAQKSCNKFIKRYQEDFSRKCRKTKMMEVVVMTFNLMRHFHFELMQITAEEIKILVGQSHSKSTS